MGVAFESKPVVVRQRSGSFSEPLHHPSILQRLEVLDMPHFVSDGHLERGCEAGRLQVSHSFEFFWIVYEFQDWLLDLFFWSVTLHHFTTNRNK